jgi:hypothetical protein
MMSPITICFVAFICIFGSAFAGILLKDILPEHLLSEDSKKIIESARGVVVGLAALTLGLLIATAKTSFDTKSTEMKEASAKMIALNRMLIRYGNESQKARDSLRQVAASGIEIIDKIGKEGFNPKVAGGEKVDPFMTNLMDLPEHNASQTLVKSSALSIGNEILLSRWKIYQSSSSTISLVFLSILVFWLMTIFFSLGLIAPFNASVIAALGTAALSMTGAILLTLELDQPYGGLIQLSTQPLKMALAQFR